VGKGNEGQQVYRGNQCRKIVDFVSFLHQSHPNVLVKVFRGVFETLPNTARKRKNQLQNRRFFVIKRLFAVDKERLLDTTIIYTDNITKDVVLQWFAEFKGRGNTILSKSVFRIAQSTLVDLWKRHGKSFPKEFYAGVNDVKKGAQQKRAQEKVEGLVPMEKGKATVPGHLFLELAEALLKSKDDIFCHTFAICSWMLMCRVSNVADLRYTHFSWENDALMISIVRHKADKEGKRIDSKHCYANRLNSNVCIVTALCIYFAVFSVPTNTNQFLFDGKS
jgi:hypothetical protein